MINSAGARGGARLRDTDPMEAEMTILSFATIRFETMHRSMLVRAPMWRTLAFAAGLGLGTLSCAVHAAPASGGDTVRGLYDALLSTMKNGRTLGQSGRFTKLDPVIRRSFDIAEMARLSLGRSWAGLSDAQRQQMTDSYGRYVSAIYADRFDSYAGQKLEVTGEEPAPSGVMVRSRIIKADGEPVKVDYTMHRAGDGWLMSNLPAIKERTAVERFGITVYSMPSRYGRSFFQ